jgi:hypothetical protein
MSEHQVRTRLYDPPEAVRRIDSMMACWKLTSGPTVKGEDVRKAFEKRLDKRADDVVAAPVQSAEGPRIRLIA